KEWRKEWPVTGGIRGTGGSHGTKNPAKNTEKTAMVRIGIVGVGFMGMIHYLAAQKLSAARVHAICTRDPKKLSGDWTSIRGTFAPAGPHMTLGDIKRYPEFDQLLADPDIALVDICTPTHLHPSMAIAALQAGKHVLVEKAIALTVTDADAMVAAARNANRL